MKLVAVYIPEYFLFEEPQTINFGGINFYNIELEGEIIIISKKDNYNYISNFYGEEISLVSAIVGENGSGKTSLIKNIISDSKNIFIYENDKNDVFITINKRESKFTKTVLKLNFKEANHLEFEIGTLNKTNHFGYNIINNMENIPNLSYYSPLSCFNPSLKNLDAFCIPNSDINEIYTESILRNVEFLSRRNLIRKIKTLYNDFPSYSKLIIKPKEISKRLLFEIDMSLFEMYRSHLAKKDKKKFSNLDTIDLEIELMREVESNNHVILFSVLSGFYEKKSKNELYHILIHLYIRFLKVLFVSIGIGHYKNVSIILVAQIQSESFSDNLNFVLLLDSTIEIGFNSVVKKSKLFSNKTNVDEIKETIKQFINLLPKTLALNLYEKKNDKLQELFSCYNKLIYSFESLKIDFDFKIDNSFLLFMPNHSLSQGEEYLINFFSGIYSNNDLKNKNFHLLFLDEPDLGFHPMWSKKFINAVVNIMPLLFDDMTRNLMDSQMVSSYKFAKKNYAIQIIFTTHSPMTLSDVSKNNVIYLEKVDNKIEVSNLYFQGIPKKSFGANISDMLSDSFFIRDGLIGDFAKIKINRTINWLNFKLNKTYNEEMVFSKLEQTDEYHKNIIDIIDEPLIKNKLRQMYIEATNNREEIQAEIDRLQSKLNKDD